MSRRDAPRALRWWPLVMTVCAAPLLLAPAGGTAAGWREELAVTAPDASSDTFSATVADVSNAVDHSQATPGDVSSEPGILVTNGAARHDSWIDVVSTRVTVPSGLTSSLLEDVDIDYDVAARSDCLTGLDAVSPYWNVAAAGVGGLVAGTTYPRPSTRDDSALLEPGASKVVCPFVRPGYDTSTAAGRADFLRAHAGRRLDLTTVVRQRAESPATWSSPERTFTTRYQVKAPPPTTPTDGVVCHRTGAAGNRNDAGLWGKLYWAWPFADGSSSTLTPAVDRFVSLRSADGLTWEEFREWEWGSDPYSADGDERSTGNINSSDIDENGTDWHWFTVRAYLQPGPSPYVDAVFMVQMREPPLSDHLECGAVQLNPSAGPRGL